MAWLHTWAGLLPGWILFAVFLTGTVSYFRPEISQWMRPELPFHKHGTAVAQGGVEKAAAWLQASAPSARRWMIVLPTARDPVIHATFWQEAGRQPSFASELLDPSTGQLAGIRASLGGDGLYYFHFDLLMPSIWGRLVVGVSAMAMLVAIVSGVVTHRRIFRDFFVFRPNRGQRSWLDAHNVFGVLALPYHVMITYSGLVTLMFLYMPWGVDLAYPNGREAFFDEAGLAVAPPAPAGRRVPLTALAPLLTAAQELWDGGRAGRIDVYNPGDANARIVLYRSDDEALAFRSEQLLFDGASGAQIPGDTSARPARETRNVLYGLHIARFADPILRGLFFCSGIAGTAMIASGLVLWTAKRRNKGPASPQPSLGFRLVERLNLAVLAGLPVGIAAHFLANRVLPLDIAERAAWELRCLFIAWGLVALWAVCRPLRRGWVEVLALGAGLFAVVPLVNGLTTGRGLVASFAAGDWVFFGFDGAALVVAVLMAGLCWRVAVRGRGQGRGQGQHAEPTAGEAAVPSPGQGR